MTTLQLDIERPSILFKDSHRTLDLTARRPGSLDTAIVGVWEDLRTRNAAPCLVCGGTMTAAGETGACEDCGASLS